MVNRNFMLFIFSSFIIITDSKSLYVCDEDHADVFLGSAWVEVPAQQHTTLVRRVRLPTEGLYDGFITCLLATDVSIDDSGGEVDITEGGVGHRYVGVRMTSQFEKKLDYVVTVYSDKLSSNATKSYIVH